MWVPRHAGSASGVFSSTSHQPPLSVCSTRLFSSSYARIRTFVPILQILVLYK